MAVVQIVTRELDGTETVTEVEVDDPTPDLAAQVEELRAVIAALLGEDTP